MTVLGINTLEQDRIYTWTDLKPKPQRYPYRLTELWQQIDDLDREYTMLTDLEPLPYGDLERVADKLEKVNRELDLVWTWYVEIPRTCEACGAPIVASGEVMRCINCSISYHPSEALLDTIPF